MVANFNTNKEMRQKLTTKKNNNICNYRDDEAKKNKTKIEVEHVTWFGLSKPRPFTKFLRKMASMKVGANLQYNIKTKSKKEDIVETTHLEQKQQQQRKEREKTKR